MTPEARGDLAGEARSPGGPAALVLSAGANFEATAFSGRYRVVGVVTSWEAATSVIPVLRPDVLLVDPSARCEAVASDMVKLIQAAFPSVKVEIARSGESLDRPGHDGEVTVPAPSAGAHSCGGIVTVWSPKGGAGRTFIACNLAACVSARGGRRTVLVDLDLKSGDVGVHLNVRDAPTILDALPYVDDGSAAAVSRFAVLHKQSGISVLPAPGRPELSELVAPAQLRRLVAVAQSEYEYVILDTPADSASEVVYECIESAWKTVLVVTQDVACLRRTRVMMDVLEKLCAGAAAKTVVVLNLATESGPVNASSVESFLGIRVCGAIPEDRRAVERSVYDGIPIVLADPGAKVSKALGSVAGEVFPCCTGAQRRRPGLSAALVSLLERGRASHEHSRKA
ncbi:MAG: hypothetical protein NUV93_00350 [Firmicutes bacterium]|jgi:MinD-like ATPase involved in chromosome partitioning or flagellar assembly|nr:hypothetical protein [Bacillota bacterium]